MEENRKEERPGKENRTRERRTQKRRQREGKEKMTRENRTQKKRKEREINM